MTVKLSGSMTGVTALTWQGRCTDYIQLNWQVSLWGTLLSDGTALCLRTAQLCVRVLVLLTGKGDSPLAQAVGVIPFRADGSAFSLLYQHEGPREQGVKHSDTCEVPAGYGLVTLDRPSAHARMHTPTNVIKLISSCTKLLSDTMRPV